MKRSIFVDFSPYLIFIPITFSTQLVGADVVFRTVALTGEHAPGTPVGVKYSEFKHPPVINDHGRVAFRGMLAGEDVFHWNDNGIWSDGLGPLTLVAREADPAPGAYPGFIHKSVFHPSINGSGQVAFGSRVSDSIESYSTSSYLWAGAAGSPIVIAYENMPAPGAPDGVEFDSCGVVSFNNAGPNLIYCGIDGDGIGYYNGSGLWRETNGSMDLIALGGDQAPGLAPWQTFWQPGPGMMNSSGQVAIRSAIVRENGSPPLQGTGIWSTRNGVLEKVAWRGDPAPGTTNRFDYFSDDLGLDDVGYTAFSATLSGGDTSVWVEASEGLMLVARQGEQASGMGPGILYKKVARVLKSRLGDVAFVGTLTGAGVDRANDLGIWVQTEGRLEPVVRLGDEAPGAGDGTRFTSIHPEFAINGLGHIAFDASALMPGGEYIRGIWATDRAGELALIVRQGQFMDVSNESLVTDLREVSNVAMALSPESRQRGRSAFNDAGQLALKIEFTDGSEGIFTATIPEPGVFMMLGLGCVYGVLRRG